MGVLGIDPGRSSGAIAYVWRKGGKLHGKAFYLSNLTEYEIWDLLKQYSKKASFVVLEKIHATPARRQVKGKWFGRGGKAQWSLGMSFGELRMAVIASGLRLEYATPQKWQKAMRCMSEGDKKVTRTRAQEVFPNIKVTHKNADSLLLAEYGRRFLSKIVK